MSYSSELFAARRLYIGNPISKTRTSTTTDQLFDLILGLPSNANIRQLSSEQDFRPRRRTDSAEQRHDQCGVCRHAASISISASIHLGRGLQALLEYQARPMAPVRSSTRRGQIPPHALHNIPPSSASPANHDLFIDPMLGSPLAMYIEKDVDDRNALVDLITVRRRAFFFVSTCFLTIHLARLQED